MTRRETFQLLAFLASFIVAGYAAVRLAAGNPIGIGAWSVDSVCVPNWSSTAVTCGIVGRGRRA